MNQKSQCILTLTDGRAGHETQTKGLCTILNADQEYRVEQVKVKTISKLKNSILKWGYNYFSKEWMLGQLIDLNQFEDIDIDDIRYIVSAGGDTLLANAVLKSYLNSLDIPVQNVIATSLRRMCENAYDIVFTIDANKEGQTPYIYYPIAPNKMLSFNLPEEEQESRKKLSLSHTQGVWTILIGASTAEVEIGSVEDWILLIEDLIKQYPADEFYVSTSRRTPKAFEQSLKNVLKQYSNLHLVLVGEGDKTSIKDLMFAANIIMSSPDSTSMVSEGLMLQKPLFVVQFPDSRMNEEFRQYYEDKIKRGWLQFYSEKDFNISSLNDFKYVNHARELYKIFHKKNNL